MWGQREGSEREYSLLFIVCYVTIILELTIILLTFNFIKLVYYNLFKLFIY